MKPTLIEYFAAHEQLTDLDTLTNADRKALLPTMENLASPIPNGVTLEFVERDAGWRAKFRFIRAKAMAQESERISKEKDPCPVEFPQSTSPNPEHTTPHISPSSPKTNPFNGPGHIEKARHQLSVIKKGLQEAVRSIPRNCTNGHTWIPKCQGVWEPCPKCTPLTPSNTTSLSFSQALDLMKQGKKVWRIGVADYLTISNGILRDYEGPYVPNSNDILAQDWEIPATIS